MPEYYERSKLPWIKNKRLNLEHFTEASLSAVYDGNAPATKSDLQKLRSDIAQLAKELLDAFSK